MSHRLSLSGLRSSPSPLKQGGLGGFGGGNLAGPGSAMVLVGGSGAGGGGSGRSGGSLALLDLEGLSGVSGMNVLGSDCSLCFLEGALVGVWLPKTPRILGACHLLVVGRSGGRSVSEVCCAAALATALSSSRPASLLMSSSAVRLWSSSESVSRSPGRR